jgi:hypothetical protein
MKRGQMTGIDEQARTGRFGAATPGARPRQGPPEALLTAPGGQDRHGRARRRLIVGIVGALAVAGAGYAAGYFLPPRTSPPRLSQLVVTGIALPAGARVSAADLRTVTVHPGSGEPAGAVSPVGSAGLVGLVTRTALPPGTFLQRSLLAPSGAVPGAGQALVGLALKAGMVPAGGLTDGQRILVVLVRTTPSGVALRPTPFLTAAVWYSQGPDSSGTTSVSVVVPSNKATQLAGFAAHGEVAVVATGPA